MPLKALIIIGLQVDFFPFGAAELTGAEDVLPSINEWLPKFEHIIAARFSHPPEHKMFVANYPWRRPGQEMNLLGDRVRLRNYYCVRESFGAELASGFDHQKVTHTVWLGADKKWLPHSAFYDEKKQRETGLNEYLVKYQIKDLYLAGLPFEEGVLQTAIDGIEAGFNVKILKNAVQAKEDEKLTSSKSRLDKMGVEWLNGISDH